MKQSFNITANNTPKPDEACKENMMQFTKAEIKILLVDDREDNLFSIETVLEKDGYTFRKANSGRQALKILLKEFDFTLILMDVEMPDLNGFETATLIYERDKLRHIPVIFITANNYSEEYVFRGYKAGAVDYIYKPINPELLCAKLAVFVELYQKNHQLLEHEKQLQVVNLALEQRVEERTSELQNKNTELEEINSQLKKVNEDLDNLVYTASHDLKSPISNIEGLLNTLVDSLPQETKNNDFIKEVLSMMGSSIDRFRRTIQDLTEITKIQKSIEEEGEQEIVFKDIINDIQISIQDIINQSGANIVLKLKAPKIKFSRKNLSSIISNLLSNALKYRSPDRQSEILIETKQEKNFTILIVKDNGLGMNLKNGVKIFTMFKRLHDHVEGSGLGLYIVKRIISNAGGYIEVDSEVNQGSTFRVFFKNPK